MMMVMDLGHYFGIPHSSRRASPESSSTNHAVAFDNHADYLENHALTLTTTMSWWAQLLLS